MKKKLSFFAALVLVAAGMLPGCGAKSAEIARLSQSQRTDVFTEVIGNEAAPAGYAHLLIRASIKTHVEGYYAFEPRASLHGKPGYPFVVNIDGQAAEWKVDGVKDVKPKYDSNGKTSRDPEAGEGVLYKLEKKVRLPAGKHKLYFMLPAEKYILEADVTVNDGGRHVMEFKPVYRHKTLPTRIETFLKGIDRYEAYADGDKIR